MFKYIILVAGLYAQFGLTGNYVSSTNGNSLLIDKSGIGEVYHRVRQKYMPYKYQFKSSEVQNEFEVDVLARSSMKVFASGRAFLVSRNLIVATYKAKKNSVGRIDDIYGFEHVSYAKDISELDKEILADTLILENDIEGFLAVAYESYEHDINSYLNISIVDRITLVDNTINMFNHALSRRVLLDTCKDELVEVIDISEWKSRNDLDKSSRYLFQLGFNIMGHDQMEERIGQKHYGETEYFFLGSYDQMQDFIRI